MNMEYINKIRSLLDHVEKNVAPTIDAVAKACADSIEKDGML